MASSRSVPPVWVLIRRITIYRLPCVSVSQSVSNNHLPLGEMASAPLIAWRTGKPAACRMGVTEGKPDAGKLPGGGGMGIVVVNDGASVRRREPLCVEKTSTRGAA